MLNLTARPAVLALFLVVAGITPQSVLAQNDPCSDDVATGTRTCIRNQSAGVSGSPFLQKLVVRDLVGPIATSDNGRHGVEFESSRSEIIAILTGEVTIEVGTPNNSVFINTSGDNAYGIRAFSRAINSGGNAPNGPDVTVTSHGNISTTGAQSLGIVAIGLAGVGANGDSGITGDGDPGYKGGDGGTVIVDGDGVITTTTNRATGVLAISAGGDGGNGGDGGAFGGGGRGGPGGKGGTVDVNGDWRIVTRGNQAHGIWAKSVGGNAGIGGDGDFFGIGWASSGSGGVASDGGQVLLTSGGVINTYGDDAYGLYAQSVGGFGGDGGGGFNLFYSAGGNGGSAGSGGAVYLENLQGGAAVTEGARAHAIFAQSVGGGGGSGGGVDGLVADAGFGAAGGNGGAVTVINGGTAITSGDFAHGLYAQSIGGGGGDGGSAAGAGAVGGRGSDTSDGGTVHVENDGVVLTFGRASKAIYAQSIGGSGGDGGDSSGIFSVGGRGGGGGDADTVTVGNAGTLLTTGDDATAVFAQSVGGGGGNGGGSTAFGVGISVAIGGDGGDGGDAGELVTVDNEGQISTLGDRSHGVQAQSVGGGGGNGGYAISVAVGKGASLAAAFGGDGGVGGAGQTVIVDNAGDINTVGKDAHGIFAQSVGGGGGSGGFSIAASGGTGFSGALAMGGKGNSGGAGGDVVVTHSGNITTGDPNRDLTGIDKLDGANAATINRLRSGGIDTVAALAAADEATLVALGFSGSSDASVDVLLARGVDAATIQRLKDANLTTIGDLQGKRVADFMESSRICTDIPLLGVVCIPIPPIITDEAIAQTIIEQTAVYVQTIPTVVLDAATLQMQQGNHAYGILAQSVGGGGGDGGFSVAGTINAGGVGAALGMGGDGGNGGPGGNVTLESSGNVTTYGDDSHAIVAQSVGGGGGTGGFSASGSVGSGNGIAASLGSDGGTGSIGGTVMLGQQQELIGFNNDGTPILVARPLTGNISTAGDHAYGILAQSVGGGGGDGGFSVAGAITQGANAAFSMGGSGGDGGEGGLVAVNTAANITTLGRDAHGLVAQSVGGGGGSGGFSVAGGLSRSSGVAASIGGNGSTGGHAGTVTVVNSGVIQTGVGGQRDATLDALDGLDPATITLLQDNGFDTIAELASTGQSELTDIDGIDEDLANALLDSAHRFMEKDSHAYGILAQSIGGGGGDGGFSVAGSFSKDGNGAAFSMGGSGDGGGDGNIVSVRNDGTIITRAEKSTGILAQSTGGGGGSGGFSVAGRINLGSSKSGLSFAIGGSGAEGGNARSVTVGNQGDILTEGGDAHGIHAQSVGGGGGNGGFSAAGTISGSKSRQLGISLGGSGGDGGTGGDVSVDNSGLVMTLSEGSNAIYAQSIGGGGGDGGLSFAGSFADKDTPQLSASLGGAGGDGNSAGQVLVTNSGMLDTSGAFANGIQAQSIGGGGGSGGFSVTTGFATSGTGALKNFNGSVSLGGMGGRGGAGRAVTVRNCELDADDACLESQDGSSQIVTRGDDSHGIYAQSVGGGGGDGGSSLAATVGLDPKIDQKSFSLVASLGGTGGDGNSGSSVFIENAGLIDTLGHGAHGIFAQSIGGGGGSGGSARTLSVVLGKKQKADKKDKSKKRPSDGNKALTAAIGGNGGTGGIGSDVTIRNQGDIVTRGADSHGIFAQSVGGGGGEAGNGAHGIPEVSGIAGPVDDAINAAIDKAQERRNRRLHATKGVSIVVGGNGGTGNHGGNVYVDHTGNIVTLSDGSVAVLSQSVGAGGGIGGNAALGKKGLFGLGGEGGASGNGGTVDVDVAGNILTVGMSAHGIFAQSVGGGGGIAGNVDFGLIDSKTKSAFGQTITTPSLNIGKGIAVTRDGGSAGNGGQVLVNSAGTITTLGHAAIGIFAQSVGGGGGLAGDSGFGLIGEVTNVAACAYVDGADGARDAALQECDAWSGSAGGDGAGGDIDITHAGTIETFGDVAHGIFAQSSGGSADEIRPWVVRLDDDGNVVTEQARDANGNLVFDDDGEPVMVPVRDQLEALEDLADLGGDIDISIDGDILINGAYAHGIFAHSAGDDGAGNITIDLLGGTVQGGSNTGVGIRLMGGAINTLNNHGTLTSVEGVLGEAIFADTGDETINNFGTIIGNVYLGTGANAFFNNEGAEFITGAQVYLGDGNALTNAGRLSPGGQGQVATTMLTGDYIQSGNGALAVDLDMQTEQSDTLDVTGTANLGGVLELNILNPGSVTPGSGQVTVVTAANGVTGPGFDLNSSASAVAGYELSYPNAAEAILSWNVNFAPVGFTGNAAAIGEYINAVQLAGGSAGTAPVVATLYALPDSESLTSAYNQLSPQVVADNHASTLNSSMKFSDALLSCKVRDGENRFMREGDCVWLQVTTREFSREATSEHMGYNEDAWQAAGGVQKQVDGDWVVGGAWSYESRNLRLSTGTALSDGSRMQGGIVLKRLSGASTFSTSFAAGYALYENVRSNVGGFSSIGDERTWFTSAQLRGERTLDYGSSYLKPRIDLGISYFSRDSGSEEGFSTVSLDIEDGTDTQVYTQLGLEVGAERVFDNGLMFRPRLGLGVTQFLTDSRPVVTASILGAPDAAGTFTVTGDIDRTYYDLDLGFDFLTTSEFVLHVGAFGRLSTTTRAHGATLKVAFPF